MPGDVTQILSAIGARDSKAAEELLPLVYDELRKMAHARMVREHKGQTLQATALVHEAWLKMGGDRQPNWQNRAHFFGAAAEAMRRILIDRARKRQLRQSSGLDAPVELHESRFEIRVPESELLAIHEVLDQLADIDGDTARLVKLRFFVGMNMAEASEVMGFSLRQGERHWTFAKAWLRDALNKDG